MSKLNVNPTKNEGSASESAKTISIYGLEKIPLVKPGDDAAQLIMGAIKTEGLELVDVDVVVVSQKIVSKA